MTKLEEVAAAIAAERERWHFPPNYIKSVYEVRRDDEILTELPMSGFAVDQINALMTPYFARAAIAAMREPSMEMIEEGRRTIGDAQATEEAWEMMVDAALGDAA